MSPANQGVSSDPFDMIMTIRKGQRSVYAMATQANRDYFATNASLTSTTGTAGRVVSLPTNCGRVRSVVLTATQTPISIVDIEDMNGELSPRAFIFGQQLVEVSNDWSASPGPVAILLYFVQSPTDLDPFGDLTQIISLPDDWSHLLILDLATYLAHKDPARDPAEVERLEQMSASAQQDFVSFMTEQGGVKSMRFRLPSPMSDGAPAANKT